MKTTGATPPHGEDLPDEAELEAFADRLGALLREDLQQHAVPADLAARLERTTREHVADGARSAPFFVAVAVLVIGLAGAAVWTPLILGGIAVLAVGAGVADQLLRRLRDRTLAQVLRAALARDGGGR